MRLRIHAASFAVLMSFTYASAAPRAATESFIGSAWRDQVVTLREGNLKTFGSASFANPIERLQLRLSQGQYSDDRKAGLRAYPRGFREYGLLRQLNFQAERIEDLSYRNELGKALRDRYQAAVEYRFASDSKKLLTAINQNVRRAMSMQSASTRADAGKARDLLKAREAVSDARMKAAEAEMKYRAAVEKLRLLDSQVKPEKISSADWPDPSDLEAILDRFAGRAVPTGSVDVKLAREQVTRSRDALSFDLAKDSRLIDYLEFSVSQDRDEQKYSIEVAINIPWFSSAEFSYREKARQLVKYEIEAVEVEREQVSGLAGLRAALSKAVETHKQAADSDDSVVADRIKALARRHDPMLANALEKEGMERRLRIAQNIRDAYVAFFEYLSASGTLAERPRVNFLNKELKELTP